MATRGRQRRTRTVPHARVSPGPGQGLKNRSRSYVVINVVNVGGLDYSELGEDAASTVRFNSTGTLALVKWVTADGLPVSLPAGAISHLTADEARTLVRSQAWAGR